MAVAPAIANAVYHATGKRVRDLPITIEKLLWRGPPVVVAGRLAGVPDRGVT